MRRAWPSPIPQNAIDEVFRLGGGRVVVGRGFYSIKGLRLRSRVTLYLERGAILQASRNAADFDILGKDAVEPIPAEEYERGRSRRWSPPRGELERTSPRLHISDPLSPWNDAIIRVLNARDVAIIGEEGAVIDGANGYNPKGELNYRGVHGISAIASTNVVLRGFTMRHSGHWAMLLRYCGNVTCERVTALGGHDGFHARGCDISSSCNALRLGGRDILIENCHAHGPCEYVFRDRLPAQAKIEGLWNSAVVPGRHTMATFFIYICDYTRRARPLGRDERRQRRRFPHVADRRRGQQGEGAHARRGEGGDAREVRRPPAGRLAGALDVRGGAGRPRAPLAVERRDRHRRAAQRRRRRLSYGSHGLPSRSLP